MCGPRGTGTLQAHKLGDTSSVVGAPAGGRCGPDVVGLERPGSPTACEAQSIAAHGSPEEEPAATAPRGIHYSWKRKRSD